MFDRLKEAARSEFFELEHLVHHEPKGVVRKTEPKLHTPQLNLADYVESEAQPPAAVHRSHLGNPLLKDPLGNTDWGDCGDAMTLHAFEAFHLDAGTPPPPFVTGDALHLYSAVSGFDPNQGPPGQNPTDQGTDNQQLVNYLLSTGALCAADGSVHRATASLFVDPADPVLSRIAMWEFVALFRAVGLPNTAQGQQAWKVVDPSLQGDAAVGSWGYHDIPYFSYDGQRIRTDSWGLPILVDWDFDRAYAVQGFVLTTQDQLNLQGVSPAGVNWTKLNADIAKLPSVQPS
jgi:hypothetical protein